MRVMEVAPLHKKTLVDLRAHLSLTTAYVLEFAPGQQLFLII